MSEVRTPFTEATPEQRQAWAQKSRETREVKKRKLLDAEAAVPKEVSNGQDAPSVLEVIDALTKKITEAKTELERYKAIRDKVLYQFARSTEASAMSPLVKTIRDLDADVKRLEELEKAKTEKTKADSVVSSSSTPRRGAPRVRRTEVVKQDD